MVRTSGLMTLLNSLEGGVPRARVAIGRRQEAPFRELLAAAHRTNGIETASAAIGSGLTQEPLVSTPGENSTARQKLATLAGNGSEPPQAGSNYVPFEKGIPAYDIGSINDQQRARNDAFTEWIEGIVSTLAGMGIQPDVTLEQQPTNLYVQPVRATLTFSRDETTLSSSLSLYHYDAWQGRDAAKLALSMGTVPEEES